MNKKATIIVLLNNIDELVSKSNNRKEAIDVMMALRIYARTNGINVPEQKIEQYLSVVFDSRPQTLSVILKDISIDVLKNNK